jgi:hypothetical protein
MAGLFFVADQGMSLPGKRRWISAFAGMTVLEVTFVLVIPTKAEIQRLSPCSIMTSGHVHGRLHIALSRR